MESSSGPLNIYYFLFFDAPFFERTVLQNNDTSLSNIILYM